MYCSFSLVVGCKILWYFKLKILGGLNPSLLLAGNILSRVVLYIWYICIVRQTARAASQPFQTQPLCPLIAHNIQ
jgi:hypothetical protein